MDILFDQAIWFDVLSLWRIWTESALFDCLLDPFELFSSRLFILKLKASCWVTNQTPFPVVVMIGFSRWKSIKSIHWFNWFHWLSCCERAKFGGSWLLFDRRIPSLLQRWILTIDCWMKLTKRRWINNKVWLSIVKLQAIQPMIHQSMQPFQQGLKSTAINRNFQHIFDNSGT